MVGIEPGHLTLRELVWMAEARVREAWSRTSSIMALMANCHRPRKSKLFRPSDFNPMGLKHRSEKLPRVGVSALRDIFVTPHHTPRSLPLPGEGDPT